MSDPLVPQPTGEPSEGYSASETPIQAEMVREEVRKIAVPQIQHAMGFQVAMGPPPNTFIEKLQPGHIQTILDHTKADKSQEHYRIMILFIASLLAFLGICGMFLYAGKDASLEKIISAFIGFVGGFGVGKWTGQK